MSLKPERIPPVPEETARIARAAFQKGDLYMIDAWRAGLVDIRLD